MPTVVTQTIGASGEDYSSVSGWEGATDNNHVTADEVRIGSLVDTSYTSETINIRSSTCDATRYRILRAASGNEYDPIAGTGARITWTGAVTADIDEPYSRVESIGFIMNASVGNNRFRCENVGQVVLNCVFDASGGSFSGSSFAPLLRASASDVLVMNTIVIGSGVSGEGYSPAMTGVDGFAFHCSIYNCNRDDGMDEFVDTAGAITNCAIHSSAVDDFGATLGTESYNASGDATASGTGSLTSVSLANMFNDAASDDFRPGSSTEAAGTDLSADSRLARFLPANHPAYTGNVYKSFEPGVFHDDNGASSVSIGPYLESPAAAQTGTATAASATAAGVDTTGAASGAAPGTATAASATAAGVDTTGAASGVATETATAANAAAAGVATPAAPTSVGETATAANATAAAVDTTSAASGAAPGTATTANATAAGVTTTPAVTGAAPATATTANATAAGEDTAGAYGQQTAEAAPANATAAGEATTGAPTSVGETATAANATAAGVATTPAVTGAAPATATAANATAAGEDTAGAYGQQTAEAAPANATAAGEATTGAPTSVGETATAANATAAGVATTPAASGAATETATAANASAAGVATTAAPTSVGETATAANATAAAVDTTSAASGAAPGTATTANATAAGQDVQSADEDITLCPDVATLESWLSTTGGDRTSETQIAVAELTTSGDYNLTATLELAATGITVGTNHRVVRSSNGNEFDSRTESGPKLVYAGHRVLHLNEDGAEAHHLGIEYTGSSNRECVRVSGTVKNIVDSCVGYRRTAGSTGAAHFIRSSGSDSSEMRNCIAIGPAGAVDAGINIGFQGAMIVENCIAYGIDDGSSGGVGFEFVTVSLRYVRNAIGGACGASVYNGATGLASPPDMDYCISDDTSAVGTNSFASETLSTIFVDAPNGDFRLLDNANNAIGNGIDLSAGGDISAQGADGFSLDFLNVAHGTNGAGSWNIGSHDAPAVATQTATATPASATAAVEDPNAAASGAATETATAANATAAGVATTAAATGSATETATTASATAAGVATTATATGSATETATTASATAAGVAVGRAYGGVQTGEATPASATATAEDVAAPAFTVTMEFVQADGSLGSTPEIPEEGQVVVATVRNTDFLGTLPQRATITWNWGETGEILITDPRPYMDGQARDLGTELHGFSAAYRYDSAGAYAMTATVVLEDGTESTSSQTNILVSVSTRVDRYVSSAGTDDPGSGAIGSPYLTLEYAIAQNGSDTNYYLNRGDTFDPTAGVDLDGLNNVEIGPYGSGALPTIEGQSMAVGEDCFSTNTSTYHIRVHDIEFVNDQDWTSNGGSGGRQIWGGGGNLICCHDIEFQGNGVSGAWRKVYGADFRGALFYNITPTGTNGATGEGHTYSVQGHDCIFVRCDSNGTWNEHLIRWLPPSGASDPRDYGSIGNIVAWSDLRWGDHSAGAPKGMRIASANYSYLYQNNMLGCHTAFGYDGNWTDVFRSEGNHMTSGSYNDIQVGGVITLNTWCRNICMMNNVFHTSGRDVTSGVRLVSFGNDDSNYPGNTDDVENIDIVHNILAIVPRESSFYTGSPNQTGTSMLWWPATTTSGDDINADGCLYIRGNWCLSTTVASGELTDEFWSFSSRLIGDFIGYAGYNCNVADAQVGADFGTDGGGAFTFSEWNTNATDPELQEEHDSGDYSFDFYTTGDLSAEPMPLPDVADDAYDHAVPLAWVRYDYRGIERNQGATNWPVGPVGLETAGAGNAVPAAATAGGEDVSATGTGAISATITPASATAAVETLARDYSSQTAEAAPATATAAVEELAAAPTIVGETATPANATAAAVDATATGSGVATETATPANVTAAGTAISAGYGAQVATATPAAAVAAVEDPTRLPAGPAPATAQAATAAAQGEPVGVSGGIATPDILPASASAVASPPFGRISPTTFAGKVIPLVDRFLTRTTYREKVIYYPEGNMGAPLEVDAWVLRVPQSPLDVGFVDVSAQSVILILSKTTVPSVKAFGDSPDIVNLRLTETGPLEFARIRTIISENSEGFWKVEAWR